MESTIDRRAAPNHLSTASAQPRPLAATSTPVPPSAGCWTIFQHDPDLRVLTLAIRAEHDKEKRNALKAKQRSLVWAVALRQEKADGKTWAVSGEKNGKPSYDYTNRNYHNVTGLTGVLFTEIDRNALDAAGITAEAARDAVAKLPYVIFSRLSGSGQGVHFGIWCPDLALAEITDADALRAVYQPRWHLISAVICHTIGLPMDAVDRSAIDPTHVAYAAWDGDGYINRDPAPFQDADVPAAVTEWLHTPEVLKRTKARHEPRESVYGAPTDTELDAADQWSRKAGSKYKQASVPSAWHTKTRSESQDEALDPMLKPAGAGRRKHQAQDERPRQEPHIGSEVLIRVDEIAAHYGVKCRPHARRATIKCPVCATDNCQVFYVQERVGVRCDSGICRPRAIYTAIEAVMGRGTINRPAGDESIINQGNQRYQSIAGTPPEDQRADCEHWCVLRGDTPNGLIWRSYTCGNVNCPGCEANRRWVARRRTSLGILDGQTCAWVAGFGTLSEAREARRELRRHITEPAAIQLIGAPTLQKTLSSNDPGDWYLGIYGEFMSEWFLVTVSDSQPGASEMARLDAVASTKNAAAAQAASVAHIKTEQHRLRLEWGKPTKRSQAAMDTAVARAESRRVQALKAMERRRRLGTWDELPDVMMSVELAGALPGRWKSDEGSDVNAISWGSGETAWWVSIADSDGPYQARSWKADPEKQGVPAGGWIADNDADRAAMKNSTEKQAIYHAELWCQSVKPIPAEYSQELMRAPAIRRHKHAISKRSRQQLRELTGYDGPAQLIWDTVRYRSGLRGWRDAFAFVEFEGYGVESPEPPTCTCEGDIGCKVCQATDRNQSQAPEVTDIIGELAANHQPPVPWAMRYPDYADGRCYYCGSVDCEPGAHDMDDPPYHAPEESTEVRSQY